MHTTISSIYSAQRYAGDRREASGVWHRAVGYIFERIRIPLAKFEPTRRHYATHSAIARPAVRNELGVGWNVSNDIYVSRRQLADDLLSTLKIL
jgi:hypothetical protein